MTDKLFRVLLVSMTFGFLTAASCSGATEPGPDGEDPACTFRNPIGRGADPWVVRQGDDYYFVESRNGGIWVSRNKELQNIKSGAVKVWSSPATGWNRSNIWAPELHFVDGKWYIYYAAGEAGPPFIHQRSGVLEAATDDPLGSWIDRGQLYTGDDLQGWTDNKWAIDVNVFKIKGQLYAVWSGWETNQPTDKTAQHLYIATMSNPYTISSNRVRLSSPEASWETGGELDLQEGPEYLEHGGSHFIIYSTRESWLEWYRLGQLRLISENADPMNPASWVKTGPVFTGTDPVFGVGHASFTTSPDGTEHWIVYHSKVERAPGWNRVVRMQLFSWNNDGSPHFGAPVASNVDFPVPSGQCKP